MAQAIQRRFGTAILVVGLCVMAGEVAADEAGGNGGPGVAEMTSEFVKDYLSDRRRVGSLAGSVIGGALTAHPAGPVVGGIIGFMVGKQTMFEDGPASADVPSVVDVRRAIVPDQGSAVATLSFDDPAGISFAPPVATATATAPHQPTIATVVAPAALAPQPLGPPALPGMTREQLAGMCASGGAARSDPRLRGVCFYFQTN